MTVRSMRDEKKAWYGKVTSIIQSNANRKVLCEIQDFFYSRQFQAEIHINKS